MEEVIRAQRGRARSALFRRVNLIIMNYFDSIVQCSNDLAKIGVVLGSSNNVHNTQIYDKCQTAVSQGLEKWFAIGNSKDTPQPLCELQVGYPLMRFIVKGT